MKFFSNIFRSPNITLRTGQIITFEGLEYGSVGITYSVKYPNGAFDSTRQVVYKHPEEVMMGMPGSDESRCIYQLTALRKGKFIVEEVENDRIHGIKRTKHLIKVK